jgi:hypothetical protein
MGGFVVAKSGAFSVKAGWGRGRLAGADQVKGHLFGVVNCEFTGVRTECVLRAGWGGCDLSGVRFVNSFTATAPEWPSAWRAPAK